MAALMLGIDFSKTDMQISLWNEEKACAQMYNFTGLPTGEVLPMMVIADEQGKLLAAKEALDYSMRTKKPGVTSLYGNFSEEPVELGGKMHTITELFAAYLQNTLGSIRRRYGGAPIAKIGITGERLTRAHIRHLTQVMELLGYGREKLFFSTHADAFLWYELFESVAQNTVSMTMDFDSKGVKTYIMTPKDEGKGLPCYLTTVDYSEFVAGSLPGILEPEGRAAYFENIAGVALARQNVTTLYVTGAFAEDKAILKVLQRLSEGNRRVFAGRGLYCLGACWQAVKEKLPKEVLADRQIFHNVFLEAYQDAKVEPVLLLCAGSALDDATRQVQVILDDVRELKFRVEDVRRGESISCTLQPENLMVRENKTIRLEVELRFLDYETLVFKIRDIGFGEIYPATYRVWEQMLHLA